MSDTGKELSQIITDKNRIITDNIEECYLSDTLGRRKGYAEAVVFPTSTKEVSDLLRFAYQHAIPITPRGAGTNLVGSTVPLEGGIVLDLSKMNRILELDKETFTAVVEPGVLLQDFQSFVEAEGLFYPPDPGEKTATLGGNISTNAGGMRAVKYGVTRDYVRGLEVVLANGEVMMLGSKNVKDSTGLSLKNLMIGSEGTLAVITKCILKVLPKPKFAKSVLVPYPALESAIDSVLKIIRENTNPTAIEFVERKVIQLGEDFLKLKFPYPNAEAYIILTFDGSLKEIGSNMNRAKQVVLENGGLDFLVLEDPETVETVWKIRGALVKAVEAVSEQEPVDIVVPINKTAEFIKYVNDIVEKTNMQMISFGHAGDGNVHLCVVRGKRTQEEWNKELKANMHLIYNKAFALGGLTSGEHGIGISKQPYFFEEMQDINLRVMQQIKKTLDEKGILNNHKVYCDSL